MSFKGFTKAIARAPQNFREKFKMGEQTVDPVYEDAERRFKELEDETKRLSGESKRYSDAVNGMLRRTRLVLPRLWLRYLSLLVVR